MRRYSQPTWAAPACSSARDCTAAVTAVGEATAFATVAVAAATVMAATFATATAVKCVANGGGCFAVEWRFFEHFEMSGGSSNV